jgi:DNA-binding NtrC family response regulator
MNRKTILIAFQDDQWISPLSTLFQSLGYRVETARVVSEMIRKIRKGDTQVVLLDDEMEGIKAWDLIPLLKRSPRVQIIGISSVESLTFLRRLRGAGIFYQAMKPIDLEEIRSAVACAFDKIERERMKAAFFPSLVPNLVPA